MANNPNIDIELQTYNRLVDVIKVSESTLTSVTNSFGGLLDSNISSELSKYFTFQFNLGSSPGSQNPFFDKVFEQGIDNFYDQFKDLGVMLNAYRSTYIPEELAKNIASDVSDIKNQQLDLVSKALTNETVEDIEKISSKKFLKESFENCFMRLMGLPTSDHLVNTVAYMDSSTGVVSSLNGADEVPFKVTGIMNERQALNYKFGKVLDNTFYDISRVNTSNFDPFLNLDPSVVNVLKLSETEAYNIMASESVDPNTLNSDETFIYYTRALAAVAQREFSSGNMSFVVDRTYVEGIKGEGSLREMFDFIFYGKIKGAPILKVADEIKSYSYLMLPTVQDIRINKCVAERGKYIAPPFEHQTGFRLNNDIPTMSFLEGIIRIRLDKLSGYDPAKVQAISKNSGISNTFSLEDVDGSYSVLESLMINRLVATLKICSKRLKESCRSYVKNAIKSDLTLTTSKLNGTGQQTNNSKGDVPEDHGKYKSVGGKGSGVALEKKTISVMQGIEDSMILLLGDTSKGLDVQNGTLRKSSITDTPLMNLLVSSVTVPSKYIQAKKDAANKNSGKAKSADMEEKKREISSIIGIGRGVGILDALVFILAMLTVKESVLVSMLTARQYDNLKKEFGDQKFFENFERSRSFMSIEGAVREYSYQVGSTYDLFSNFLKGA
jgi:hypothetical protein